MSPVQIAKDVVKRLGLLRAVLFVCNQYFKLDPIHECRRAGITYRLDCRELIDRQIFLLGAWERTTTRFIEEYVRPGAVVLEVGANVGAHTLLLAQRVGPKGHVYAFEPTEFARDKLRTNIGLNPELAGRISVVDALVTDRSHSTPRRDIRSSWNLRAEEQAAETVTSEATSLDEFVLANSLAVVDFVKIDVDGYDCKVLRGATELLNASHPAVFVELCEYALREQGDSIQSIFELLQSFGYSAIGESGARLPTAAAALEIVGDSSSTNALFTAQAAPA